MEDTGCRVLEAIDGLTMASKANYIVDVNGLRCRVVSEELLKEAALLLTAFNEQYLLTPNDIEIVKEAV